MKFKASRLGKWLVSTLALAAGLPLSATATPSVFNHSETAQPGDAIYFQGGWGNQISVKYQVITSSVTPNVANATALPIVSSNVNKTQSANSFVAVQVPSSAALGLYAFWLNDGSGWTAPIYVNQAHATHPQFPQVYPGFVFAMFGRNLLLNGFTPSVYFVDTSTNTSYAGTVYTGGVATNLSHNSTGAPSVTGINNSTASNSNVLWVSAPSGIPVGHSLNIVVNNGAAGTAQNSASAAPAEEGTAIGWTTTTTPSSNINGANVSWNTFVPWQEDYLPFENNVYDVTKSPYNVKAGSGVSEAQAQANAQGIQNAINAASSAGGGVVYIPAGTYLIDYFQTTQVGEMMQLKANVVVIGAGPTSTVLQYGLTAPPTTQGTGNLCVFWVDSNRTGLLDLGLNNASNSSNVTPGDQDVCVRDWGKDEFLVENCVFTANQAQTTVLGGTRLSFDNVSFLCNGTNIDQGYWAGCSYFTITNCYFTYNCGRNWDKQSYDLTVFNNHVTRLGAVSSKGNVQAGAFDGYGVHVTYAGNVFDSAAQPNTDNDDGEQILSEYWGGTYTDAGTATAATSTTLTDTGKSWTANELASPASNPPQPYDQADQTILFIVSGPGTGQWRYVVSNTASTLTLDHAWSVTPTAGSNYVTAGWSSREWLIVGNSISNNSKGVLMDDWSGNDVIVNNTMMDTGYIEIRPYQEYGDSSSGVETTNVAWADQIDGNTLIDSKGVVPALILAELGIAQNPDAIEGTAILGYESHRNVITAYKPNLTYYELTPVPTEDFLNVVTEGYTEPDGGFAQPRRSPIDSYNVGILGTILQGNTSNSSTNAYYTSTGAYNTVVLDPVTNGATTEVLDVLGQSTHVASGTGSAFAAGPNYDGITAAVYSVNTTADYQGESAALSGGASAIGDSYASGGYVAGGFNGTGAACTFNNVDGGAGGAYLLTTTYAVPSASSLDLYVDGTLIGPVNFPATSGWGGSGAYNTVSQVVLLNAGTGNTVKLQRDAGNNATNIDKINLKPLGMVANYEAEKGALAGGTQVISDNSASNGACVGGFNGNGAAVTVSNVAGGGGGPFTLVIRYAVPSASSLDLYVNGAMVADVAFPSTGAWGSSSSAWQLLAVPVTLNAGANTIKLQRDAGNNATNIDYLCISE